MSSDDNKTNNDASITMYTTPTCGFCHMAKEYFKSKNVDYVAKDITTDQNAYNEILEKTDQLGVPVIDIAGTAVIGFDRPRIDALLRENNLV